MMMTGSISAQVALRRAASTSAARLARRRHDVLLAHQPPPGEPQRDADHQARDDAGQEQLGDRNAGGDAENDEADARRNDRTDDAGGRDQPAERALSCPAFTIIGSSSAVSAAASATAEPDSAESRTRRDDRDVAQAALDVAHQRQREVDDAARQAADVHDLAGQHEEGHGQQREAVGAVDQVLRQDLRHRTDPGATSAPRRRRAARRRSACRSPWRRAAEPRKMAMVMACSRDGVAADGTSASSRSSSAAAPRALLLFGFLDHDQLVLGQLAGSTRQRSSSSSTAADTANTMPTRRRCRPRHR